MRVCNLASGSDGNLTYIESGSTKILVDDGLSCSETVRRINMLGVSAVEISAILVTHEHNDHIKGVNNFASKYSIPVFAHDRVWKGLYSKLSGVESGLKHRFSNGSFKLGNINVTPVELPHDVPCFGYSFNVDGNKISIITDLGHTNQRILESIRGSKLVYLEANYDETMLRGGLKYPLALKRRIAGPEGHLSNSDSARFVSELVKCGTKQIVLSHLSKENNSPLLAYNFICRHILADGIVEGEHVKIDVAVGEPGAIFRLK